MVVKSSLSVKKSACDAEIQIDTYHSHDCAVLQDYTIFDLGSSAERPEELARPHLHEFMSAVYPHYVRSTALC